MDKKSETFLVYDVEVFSNFFSVVFYNTKKDKFSEYYFFSGDDWPEKTSRLLEGLVDQTLVGFNNLHYDTYFLTELKKLWDMKASTTQATLALYNLSTAIIRGGTEPLKRYQFKCKDEIDLKKLMRLQRSLKWYAFQLGVIENTEYNGDFTKPLPTKDLDKVMKYNKKDVQVTVRLLEAAADDLAVRYNVRTQYEQTRKGERGKILNLDNSGLGAYIVCKKAGMNSAWKNKELEDLHIDVGNDIIFQWIKSYKWNNASFKEVFDKMCSKQLHFPRSYEKSRKFKTGYYLHKTDGKINGDSELAINMWFYSSEVKFGVGGLHYAQPFSYYDPDRNEVQKGKRVIAIDVTSYYPSLVSNNKLKPSSCTEGFIDTYTNILEHRKSIPKGTVENFAYKIALNSVFGKMRQPGSVFYDQFGFLRVVVNGQLLLAQMMDILDGQGFTIMLANTDGIFVLIDENKSNELNATIEQISDWTSLSFDKKEIKKIYIRDTNNYTSKGYGDKGYYVTSGLTLNHSASNLASKEAARQFLLNDVPIKETLKSLWYEGKKGMFCYILANSPNIKEVCFGDANPKSRIYLYYNTTKGDKIKIKYKYTEKLKHLTSNSTLVKSLDDMANEPDFNFYEHNAKNNADPFFEVQEQII